MTASSNQPAAAFTFIDLFAGIGGMRQAFEAHGGKCVFTSEWNKFAQQTYTANFGGQVHGDITKIKAKNVPDHDVLVAGFPCQSFSIAGVSKNNSLGRAHGFLDKTRGTLFFDVARIIRKKKPKAFLLENVKNLVSHDGGRTFKVILDVLDRLGYAVSWKVLDGQAVVPQHRERIMIVGFRKDVKWNWADVILPALGPKLGSILMPDYDKKYILTKGLWKYLRDYARKHKALGHGFGFGLTDANGIARTLSARYYKDGSEILISRGKRARPRRLTPRECARLMGFPDTFVIPVSDTQAYKQFGNSVVMPMIRAVAGAIVAKL